MKERLYLVIAAMVLLCTVAGIASAEAVSQTMTYQGILTDSGGNPLTGTYSMTFKLYNWQTGGIPFDTITQDVQCTNGLFSVSLPVTAADIHGQPVWLGIRIGNELQPELTPRQEIRPVPYAFSLRPDAWVTGESDGGIFHVVQEGMNGMGITAATTAGSAKGIYELIMGPDSAGVSIEVQGSNSRGLSVKTTASGSYAADVNTTSSTSPGYYAETWGAGSQGFAANTHGNSGSHGVDVATTGNQSHGVKTYTTGQESHGVIGQATGLEANGVVAYSTQWAAIYADTFRGDHQWGLYTPDDIYANGAQMPASDVAEYMPAASDAEPGTVMIIGDDGTLRVSTEANDPRVAGIVSTEPGVTLGANPAGNPGEEKIAIAGRVPCRVDASSGAIHPGDPLTTSPTPGHAMKAVPEIINGKKFYPETMILGKAMGTLESGTGTIEVLVMLR